MWHLRGSFALDGSETDDAVLDRLEQMLITQHKPIFDRGPDNVIIFDAPLWTGSGNNWLAMGAFDKGRIWISIGAKGQRLCYDLRSLHAFLLCLSFGSIILAFSLPHGELEKGLSSAAWMFGWLYGTNILLALTRVPLLIWRTAQSSAPY
jgi:hypothetical protein